MAVSIDHSAGLDAATSALEPTQCAVARCAEVVSGKWTLLIVRELAAGERSYSEIEQGLAGISPRTLCDRLKLLAARGFVTRTRIKGLPPRTMYQLTDTGRMLLPMIDTMRQVGEALARTPQVVEAIDPCSEEFA